MLQEQALTDTQRREKRTEIYTSSLQSISNYFGVSEMCSLYLFHRAFRSRRKDAKYMKWSTQLQNALVKVDKCVGVNWDTIYFGYESKLLEQHGIVISEMPEGVFRWPEERVRIAKLHAKANTTPDDDGWSTVTKKSKLRKPKVNYKIPLIKRPGLYV